MKQTTIDFGGDGAGKLKKTHVVFLLDKTGSMSNRKDETITAVNGYIADLKKDMGDEITFTLRAFCSHSIKEYCNIARIVDAPSLNSANYQPEKGGFTPLYDAMGDTMKLADEHMSQADGRLFVTLTDGEENHSTRHSRDQIAKMIEERQGRAWTFVFLGTGFDAYGVGKTLNVSTDNTVNFAQMESAMEVTASATRSYRGSVISASAGRAFGKTTNNFYSEKEKKLAEKK